MRLLFFSLLLLSSWLLLLLFLLVPSCSGNDQYYYRLDMTWPDGLCKNTDCNRAPNPFPHNHFVIHGMRAMYYDNRHNEFCDPRPAFTDVNDWAQMTVLQMREYWPTFYNPRPEDDWSYEFRRSGSCFLEFRSGKREATCTYCGVVPGEGKVYELEYLRKAFMDATRAKYVELHCGPGVEGRFYLREVYIYLNVLGGPKLEPPPPVQHACPENNIIF